VWFVPRPLLPARAGGEVRVSGLVRSAVAAGHEVMVVQPGLREAQDPVGFRVVAVPIRTGLGRAIAKIMSTSPLRTARVTASGRRAAAREIEMFRPDLAIVSDLLSWPVASDLLPDVPWILDAHNVESDLYAEFAANATNLFDRVTFGVDRRRIIRQEQQVVGRADAVVAVSPDDAEGLLALGPRRTPVVVPSSVPTPDVTARPGKAAPVVLFVGTLDHPPNVETVTELVNCVMPAVRAEVPGATLRVVGRQPIDAVRSLLASTPWVEFVEDAPTLDVHYLSARCVVLPMRTGGGSRLKVYEALAYGVPIVGTTRALSGADVAPDAAIRANSDSDQVAATIRVLTDDELAANVGAAARSYFLDRLTWDRAARPLLTLIDDLS
jgi:glycosyltransferase involved in cell wall biosynthesis